MVAGFRWYKGGKDKLLGSMLLGLYDQEGALHHVGVCSGFKMADREKLADLLRPLTEGAKEVHPWREWAEFDQGDQRMPGAKSRWTKKGKDLSWVPLRIERVAEVSYDHMQGDRFRHGTHFKRLARRQARERLPLRSARGLGAVGARQIFGGQTD